MIDKHPIQGGVEILLDASCNSYRNCDKLWPDGPLGPCTDFIFISQTSLLITIILGSCNPLQEMDQSRDSQFVSNPHLKLLDDDMLFHIGIKAGDHQKLRNLFGDVKVSFLVPSSFHCMRTMLKGQFHALLPSIILAQLLQRTQVYCSGLKRIHLCNVIGRSDLIHFLARLIFCFCF